VKMSQADLGEALGVSFQQVQKYEKGVNRVGAGRLQQIAAALGESVEYFLGKDQDTSAEGLEMQRLLADRYVLRAARAFAKLDGDVRVHMLGLLESMGK
jgi:transcriptional regulator with XRE-family HTH domain